MAFLCPSRLGKVKNKRGYYDSMMGRITGSDSIETLVKLELGKQNANNPETRRIILQSFTGYNPEEITVKQGQKVHILFREGDWAYVVTHDKKQGYVPFTYCAKIGKPPSYRAPRINKDKEKLLTQDDVDINDNDTTLNEVDTTLGEQPDESYVSEIVSDSVVSDEWSEQTGKGKTPDEATKNHSNLPSHSKLKDEDNQYTESVTIVLDDEPPSQTPQLDSKSTIHSEPENLAHSVTINSAQERTQTVADFNTKVSFGRYLVLYDFEGYYEDDACVRQADIVTVLNIDDSDWYWIRKTDNSEGFVPSNFLFRLGLLLSDKKCMVSNTNEKLMTTTPSTARVEELYAKDNPSFQTPSETQLKKIVHKGPNFTPGHDDRMQFQSSAQQTGTNVHRSTLHGNPQQSVNSSSLATQCHEMASDLETGSLSPRYCNFDFEMNHNYNIIAGPVFQPNRHSQIRDSLGNFPNAVSKAVVKEQDPLSNTEELYPPPLEFSNSDETYQNVSALKAPGNEMDSIKCVEHSHPFSVRNNYQPGQSLDKTLTQRQDAKCNGPYSTDTHQHHADVRYRTDSSGKRMSKSNPRPKSTPPGDTIFHKYHYYPNDNLCQHYESQQGSKISVHQSERLTPRTNYNYSPTYHSSVWKPYQQTKMADNVTEYVFARGYSAFQKPTHESSAAYAYNNTENTNVSKSSRPFSMHENPYYLDGVYNIRSTTDRKSPQPPVQSTIRKLSDEENQNLFRKLDHIQNSFDSDDVSLQNNGIANTMLSSNHHTDTVSGDIGKNTRNEYDRQCISASPSNHSQNTPKCHKIGQLSKISNKTTSQNCKERDDASQTLLVTANKEESAATLYQQEKMKNLHEKDFPDKNGQETDTSISNKNTQNNKDQSHKPSAIQNRNISNQRAANQNDILNVNGKHMLKQTNNSEKSTRMTEFVSQFEYKATSKTDLPLQRGEIVHVSLEDQNDKHWYWAYSPKLRRHGYVPRNYVQPEITLI